MLAEAMRAGEKSSSVSSASSRGNPWENILDLREHDLPLHVRVSIDKSIFVGSWYQVRNTFKLCEDLSVKFYSCIQTTIFKVSCRGASTPPTIVKREDLIERPDCIVLAFDIETTKLPLKFPDPNIDQVPIVDTLLLAHNSHV